MDKPTESYQPAISLWKTAAIIGVGIFLIFLGQSIDGKSGSTDSADRPTITRPNLLPAIGAPDWSIPCMDIKVGLDPTTIRIRPDQWTKPIRLPANTKFMIDHPGEMEYCFWTGERILVPGGAASWFARVPHRIFALRGKEGEIRITLE